MADGAINNDSTQDMKQVILWQYDKAPHLVGIIDMFSQFLGSCATSLYNVFIENIFDIDNLNAFGASIWGVLLGFTKPQRMSDDLYIRLIKGKLFLLNSNMSGDVIEKYLYMVFEDRFTFYDNNNMTISFFPMASNTNQEELNFASSNPDIMFCSPVSVSIIYEGA